MFIQLAFPSMCPVFTGTTSFSLLQGKILQSVTHSKSETAGCVASPAWRTPPLGFTSAGHLAHQKLVGGFLPNSGELPPRASTDFPN